MLKRTVARLLLFGVGFTVSFFATRPSPQPVGQSFIVCGYHAAERRIVIAQDPAGCLSGEALQRRVSRPGSIVPSQSGKIRIDTLTEAVSDERHANQSF